MKPTKKDKVSTMLTKIERGIRLPMPPVSILGYHAVSFDNTIVDITPDIFQKQLQLLKNTCQFITLDDVIDYINGEKNFLKPAVALTFDDGYRDVLTTIAPILYKEKIPAAAFVMSNTLHTDRSELENSKILMTIEELKKLKQFGWTIGCHSATHANLTDRTVDLTKEILDAKATLEKELKTHISYFAYPKGFYNKSVVSFVKQAGFKAAFTFEAGYISSNTDTLKIPRTPVDHTHTMEQFGAFFTHWGVSYFLLKKQFQKRGFRYE